MAPLDLGTILKGYEGKWVALFDDRKVCLEQRNQPKTRPKMLKTRAILMLASCLSSLPIFFIVALRDKLKNS